MSTSKKSRNFAAILSPKGLEEEVASHVSRTRLPEKPV